MLALSHAAKTINSSRGYLHIYLWYVEYHGEEDDWHDVLEDPAKARALVIHRLQMKWKKCSCQPKLSATRPGNRAW